MISDNMGFYLFFAGLGSLFILRFYSGKYWYIFLILGFGLVSLRFVMDKVTILTGNNEKREYLTFKKKFTYSFKNGETQSITISDNTLINDTEDKLIIEKVIYSRYASSSSGDNYMTTISPFSSEILNYSVNYFYNEPPSSISVKGGGSTTRYWLHK